MLHQPKLERADNYFLSREDFRGQEFSFLTMFLLASPLSGRKLPTVKIRTTKTVRSIQLKGIISCHSLCDCTYPSTLSCYSTPGNL